MAPETKLPPVTDIRAFQSVSEFNAYLENEASNLRSQLGESLRRLEALKAKAEMLTKFESLLSQLAKGGEVGGESREFALGPVKVVVNPSPKQELEVLVNVVRSVQERLMLIEKIKKALEPLFKAQDVEVKLEVVFENNVPTKIFIRMG